MLSKEDRVRQLQEYGFGHREIEREALALDVSFDEAIESAWEKLIGDKEEVDVP